MTRLQDTRGQVLVIAALSMIVLLLATGLVIDTGVGFMSRRDAQNIADLSAMAGTKVVADHYVDAGRTGAQVYAAIDASAQQNGCLSACTWTAEYVGPAPVVGAVEPQLGAVANGGAIAAGAQGVRVSVEQQPRTFFMGLIGRPTIDVATAATALTSSSSQIPPGVLLPAAMSAPEDMEPNQIYAITDGKSGPGNFGWLSWTGSTSAGALTGSICNPDNPAFTIPVGGYLEIEGAPGKMNKKEGRDCLDEYIANGTTVLIPIWNGNDPGGGSHSIYQIVGFAAFKLTARSQPAVDHIEGAFIEYYALSTIPAGAGATPPGPDDATFFLGLIR